MRAVAIATHSPSHIDFGGRGFIRLMSGLKERGHHVQWLTCGPTADRLTALGWSTHRASELHAARTANPQAQLARLEHACRRLVEVLADLRPDILIIDRVNTLCSAVAQQLDLPFVAVGTPGGYWKFGEGGVTVAASPPRPFREVSEALTSRLGWRRADVHSAWLRSDDLNVTFMGRSFYDEAGELPGRTAHVNLFECAEGGSERRSLGIVLGNRGKLARMRLVIQSLIDAGEIARDEPIDILAGGREDSQQLRGLLGLLESHRVTTYGWVDYAERYLRMRRVISFGGMAAVWQALNHRLPMLLVDGGVGDQRFNCRAIERLGAGEVLHQDTDGREVAESYARLRAAEPYVAAMDALCAANNYSDSLESAVDRIVKVARRRAPADELPPGHTGHE